MQAVENVTVDPRTITGWYALPGPTQQQILDTLAELASQAPEQWPANVARHLPTSEPWYVLFAPNDLLVIFRRTEQEGITILDLVLRETVERYFRPKS
jgi:hypothetical protein